MDEPSQDAGYRERMRRKKSVIAARVAKATIDKGLLLALTGNGKGKSSSAFGMVARALGHGMGVGISRGARAELIEAADTVTEMRALKHAFEAGVKAQRGIEL